MLSGPVRRHPTPPARLAIGTAFGLAVAIRAGFALSFPTIHGGDAAARLAHADTLVLGYQLPLPQALVVLGKLISNDPFLVRFVFCVWGGVLCAGMAALLGRTCGPRAALFGALLFAFDPLLVHYSIVPYQEPVAYGLLAWAFFFAASGRERIGASLMAAACFSRYEAWLFLPALAWVSRSRLAALISVSPVIAWVAWWRGLSPRGLYVLDIDLQADRLSRISYLLSKFREYETGLAIALAALGLLLAVRESAPAVLKSVAVTGLVILVVTALGHEYPPGSGLMSERLIHLPVILALALSALALGRASARSRIAFLGCIGLTVLLAGRNIRFERTLLVAAAADPDLALARESARAIDLNRAPGECVSVEAPPVDPALLDAYVSKVAAGLGDAERARERAALLANSSPDRDRIAAHAKVRPDTIREEGGCALLILVDADPRTHEDAAGATLLSEIREGPRRARVLRIP